MRRRTRNILAIGSCALTIVGCDGTPSTATESAAIQTSSVNAPARQDGARDRETRSPIKHVVVIVGENRTFDHVFATYKARHGQYVDNLLSKHIIHEDGTPAENYALALQQSAVDKTKWSPSPGGKTPYSVLPPALAGGPKTPYVSTIAEAQAAENGLPNDYYQYLTTGGTGLASGAVDTRLPNATTLPPGPFQLTPGIAYDDYAASPVHRFYQMWQQLDCAVAYVTRGNPSGCKADLFPWVETTIGAGSNGSAQPAGFNDRSTHEGSTAMGFYNVLQGDVPYFKQLADRYAMSDNFHQSIQGGTGANHVALGTGDAIWFSDGNGHALAPPTLNTENPDPAAGTNNWYAQDGYSGGTYSDCADEAQPGVGAVTDYLHAMHVRPNCDRGHYYLLNNYSPGYFGDGSVNSDAFAIPPSSVRNIGDELLEHAISWRYYGDHWNRYVNDPDYASPDNEYCDICNPFQYATSIMANTAVRTEHMKDTADLYEDIANDWLPAVSIIKPSGLTDGHPASSKLDLFEGFSKKIVDEIERHPRLWKDTAVFITFDEGGGYYDSGYVQPIDFFGDGTRIPMIVVSPHATGGRISHEYGDHVSILKFIERNWSLPPITRRSRDNLPNPITRENNPYAPVNGPALGDLFDLFDFTHY
ncbi:MAG TPA: alkaline phosphatase family protein [Polyangia bacterium]|jgi:phospholipase C